MGFGFQKNLLDETSLFLKEAELRAFPFLLDLLPELLQLFLFRFMFLLRFPYVLYIPKTARMPSFLVQKLQSHRAPTVGTGSATQLTLTRSFLLRCPPLAYVAQFGYGRSLRACIANGIGPIGVRISSGIFLSGPILYNSDFTPAPS